MIRTKKYFVFICALFFTVAFIGSIVYAHPGGTDSNGGHYDRSTGEYHYHHGYPAHQHTNGECPYDFDDITNESESQNLNFNNSDHIYWATIVAIFIISCLIIVISQLMLNEGIKNSLLWLFIILMIALVIIGSTLWLLGNIINLLFKNLDPLKIIVAFYDICYFMYSVYSLIISIKRKRRNKNL